MTNGKKIFGPFLTLLVSGMTYGADLFYLMNKGDRCQVNVITLPSQKNRTFFSTSLCPKNMIIDKDTIYYSIEKNLCTRSLATANAPEKCLGSMPDPEMSLWIDPKTKHLKGIYLKRIDEGKYTFIKDADGYGTYVFDFEGQQFKESGLGHPFIAIAVELIDGKWRRFEIASTTSEDGESLGLATLSSYFESSKGAGFAVDWHKSRTGTKFVYDINTPSLLSLFKAQELLGKADISNKKSIYFPTVFGHTIHAVGPLYFCDEPCQKPRKINEQLASQIGLNIKDKYLLVAEEYSNNNPIVVDVVTEKTVLKLPGASSAVWLP